MMAVPDPAVLLQMLMTISNVTLDRQHSHDLVAARTQWDPVYDYIVVGSGASGAVVASRLSENFKVLLLEAGGPETVVSDIPIMAEEDPPQSKWTYKTTPQKYVCHNNPDQKCEIYMGKYLGGSSTHNGKYFYYRLMFQKSLTIGKVK